jgi:hypothetical protein
MAARAHQVDEIPADIGGADGLGGAELSSHSLKAFITSGILTRRGQLRRGGGAGAHKELYKSKNLRRVAADFVLILPADLDHLERVGVDDGTKLLPPHPLISNLEQVTCRERTVTPINSAMSSRLFPCSTRFLICWILSGVNFIRLP